MRWTLPERGTLPAGFLHANALGHAGRTLFGIELTVLADVT